MAERIVYVGSYNNSKKEELINKSVDYLKENKGDKFYYILPNGKLLRNYRQHMIERVEQTFDLNLLTFDDIVDKLIEDDFYTSIGREIKEVILSEVLRNLVAGNKLNYYKNISSKRGFVKILGNIIGEIKRSLVTPEVYLEKCPEEDFYKEIGLIYREYEEQLHQHKFIDRESSFFKSLEKLKAGHDYFKGLDFIIIDEFFDFRPQELKLLKEIGKTNCSIYINMPFNRDENFTTFSRTLDTLKDLGFEIKYIGEEENSYFEKLANTIFNEKADLIAPSPNINMVKAASSYLEMKKIAEEIKKHLVEGVDINDMALILVHPQKYEDIMFQVFEEEGIPSSLDKNLSLRELPLIKEILNILKFRRSRGDKKTTINRIKSKYFNICDSKDREAIEHILRKVNFTSALELLESNILERFSKASKIKEVIKLIEDENQSIPIKGTIEDYIEATSKIINSYKIEEKIISTYDLEKNYSLIYRDLAGFNQFKEGLGKLKDLTNILDYKIPIDEFIDLLESYLSDESITEIPGNYKGINILTPVNARGHNFKIVFIPGLSQGKYPNVTHDNFFFKDENYKKLKDIGIDVKSYYDKLDKESTMFTTMISTCSKLLYLSYSENSTGEEKDIGSMFLDEVLESLDGEEIEEKLNLIHVDIDYIFKEDKSQLTTRRDLSKYLLDGYYRDDYSKEEFQMHNSIDGSAFKKLNSKILAEVEREKPDFNEYNGFIGDKNIVEDIANLHKNRAYSISYLESYAECPYSFLLNNVLKVEEMEREILEFSPLDRGIIIHNALKEYYSKYKKEIENHVLGKEVFPLEESFQALVSIMEENIKASNINIDSNIWRMRIESNAEKIINLVEADLDRLSTLKKKAVPKHLELDFGKREVFHLEVDDLNIPITGSIDRIDKYIDEDKYMIIDYKNSEYGVKGIDDMRSGLSLQIPVYILSQEGKKVVAGIYGVVAKAEFQLKIVDLDESHLINRRGKATISREEIDELLEMTKDFIVDYIDSIHQADFSINPKKCSEYCIYRNICRQGENLK